MQTELASRVSGWRAKIQPVLDEQDARVPFDIHDYGQDILDRMSALSMGPGGGGLKSGAAPALGFGTIAPHQEQYDVSRTFSAMLQLINNGNILIRQGEGGSTAPFALTLVNPQLRQLHMDTSALQSKVRHILKWASSDLGSTVHPIKSPNHHKQAVF